jgi:2-polyprenyl-6-methoxyphenol hydroxylase-like FAD-dependent oxidoreductase
MRKTIVCGGGIAGLSTAIALAAKGWSVDVYESSSAVREIGAGIFIKANSLRVLEHFGLCDRIRRHGVVLEEARTLSKDGEILQRRTLPGHNPVWNVQRQHLIQALLGRAEELGVRVHTSSRVECVGSDGTVSAGGRQLSADLVVACDGVNSIARRALGLDRPVRGSASGAIRLLVPRTSFEAEDVVREFWSSRLRIGVCPCTPADVFVYFIAPLADPRGTRVPIDRDYWAEHFPRLESEGLFARAETAGGTHHPYPVVSVRSWAKGRVALAGDAAHALPPTLGQGAGLALTNTLLLAEYASAGESIPAALAAWEHEWRWISDRTQRWARRYDWITSEWPRSAYVLRDALIRVIGRSPKFNSYMRIADRVDAPGRIVLPPQASSFVRTREPAELLRS